MRWELARFLCAHALNLVSASQFTSLKGKAFLANAIRRENVHRMMHEFQKVNHFPASTELTRRVIPQESRWEGWGNELFFLKGAWPVE